ncbi:MAG: hypothetical protein MUD08_10570 [Cytophagales bacterium]|nr:hypothetical protein [Cytophagales bacterium]
MNYLRRFLAPPVGGFLVACLFAILPVVAQPGKGSVRVLQVPGLDEYCRINPGGVSVLPSGRHVTPAGKTVRITRAPFGLKLTPDGKKALILHHNGVLTVVDTDNLDNAIRIPSYDNQRPAVLDGATFLGIAFSKDSRTAYLSGGDKGNVVIFDMEKLVKTGEISLNTPDFEESFTSDLTIDHARNELLVLDRANFRLVRHSLPPSPSQGGGEKNSPPLGGGVGGGASIKTGRIPFGIALSPDRKLAFVANVGLYEYPAVPGVTPANKDTMMLRFPPYATPSKEAEEGVTLPDGRRIPGLGSPLADEAMSVWMIDLEKNQTVAKLKTGHQIGEMMEESEIIGGSSPNSIAVGSRFAYVTNATNDNVSVIDYKNRKLIGDIAIKVDKRIDKYHRQIPWPDALWHLPEQRRKNAVRSPARPQRRGRD